MIPWVVAVRAAMPSPRPQAWQALQMAAGIAEGGRRVTLVADAGRPDGGPDDPQEWLGRWPESLSLSVPSRPHRPPIAGLLFRRSLRAAAGPPLLCRDPRVAALALRWGTFATVVHEWHIRPDGARHRDALKAPWHVTPAEGLRDDLLSAGVPADRILLLPNACGVDPVRAQARVHRSGGPVLALGLHRRGGLDLALDAWAAAPDLPRLLIAGRDQGGERALAWAQRVVDDPALTGRVRFFGPAWGRDREDLLDEASVWLTLYPDDDDTRTRLCPLQVADAAGSGLPLVATDLPSIRAMTDAAWLVDPLEPSALAAAVRQAIAAPRRYTARPSWQDRAAMLCRTVEASL
jgi:glycosyltransferase involved in cell wall biosynthesis